MTLITTAPRHRRPWGRLRGTAAVALLLLSALEQLVSAATGFPPASWRIRKLTAPVRVTWREAAWQQDRPTTPVTSVIYVPARTRVTSPASERITRDATDA
jgi:hypothetical protein